MKKNTQPGPAVKQVVGGPVPAIRIAVNSTAAGVAPPAGETAAEIPTQLYILQLQLGRLEQAADALVERLQVAMVVQPEQYDEPTMPEATSQIGMEVQRMGARVRRAADRLEAVHGCLGF